MKQQGMRGFFRKDLSAVQRLWEKLDAADAVVIGAGAGLSASAGFTYDGERFQRYFLILGRSIASVLCIQAAFTHTGLWKSIGLTGAGISMSTGICVLMQSNLQ